MKKIIAPCGLICSDCDIHLASKDMEKAEKLTIWFKKHVNKDAEPAWFHCAGCVGKREDHWSPDCWILKCCVYKNKLSFCAECKSFPCERLVKWSNENDKYKEALKRLKEMKI